MSTFLLILVLLFIIAGFRIELPLAYNRKIHTGYLILLVISLILFYSVARPGEASDYSQESQVTREDYDRKIHDYYEALNNGRLQDYEGATENGRWIFNYTGERLIVGTENDEPYNYNILLQRKPVDDGIIEIKSYMPDFSHPSVLKSTKLDFVLENSELLISEPQALHIREYHFNWELTLIQFTERGGSDKTSLYFHGIRPVILMEIPQSLQIEGDEINIYMESSIQ